MATEYDVLRCLIRDSELHKLTDRRSSKRSRLKQLFHTLRKLLNNTASSVPTIARLIEKRHIHPIPR
jgi:hypothetical protein